MNLAADHAAEELRRRGGELDSDGLVLVLSRRGARDRGGGCVVPGQVDCQAVADCLCDRRAGRPTGNRAAATWRADLDDVRPGKRRGVAGVLHVTPRDHAVGAVEEDRQQGEHHREGDGNDDDDLAARVGGRSRLEHQWFTNMVELLETVKDPRPMSAPADI